MDGVWKRGHTIDKASLTTSGVAEDGVASGAGADGLGVAEDGRDAVAAYKQRGGLGSRVIRTSNITLALDVHEEGVGSLDETLLLVHELLLSGARIQEIGD